MDFASASFSQVEPSPSPYRNHQHVAISHISMSPYCHITRYCHHHIAILSYDNHNIAIRLPYFHITITVSQNRHYHITITILYDANSMTMHDDDDDDNDDDDEDYYYIEDGDNDDGVRETLYLQYGTVTKSFETVLVPYCRQATTRTISTARTLRCHAWPGGRGVAATSAYEYGGYI